MGCSFPRMSHTTRQVESCLLWPQDLSQSNIILCSVCKTRHLNCTPPSWKTECAAFSHFREKWIFLWRLIDNRLIRNGLTGKTVRGWIEDASIKLSNNWPLGRYSAELCNSEQHHLTVSPPVKWEQWCWSLLAGRWRWLVGGTSKTPWPHDKLPGPVIN